MAIPSVTYTFTNSTVADATEVNTNFSDLINALTDGTSDHSISTLTLAGALTANGNVTLGNASGDTMTVNATPTFAAATTFSNTVTIGAYDFTVDTNTFFVDASENSVIINNGDSGATPSGLADELVVEASGTGGITIATSNANSGTLYFATPGAPAGAYLLWDYDGNTNGLFDVGTAKANAELRFLSGNASEAMRINSSGNVYVGTSSPSIARKFLVDTGVVETYIDESGGDALIGTNTSHDLGFVTSATFRMFIQDSTGNVGIGTTSPSAKFQVSANSTGSAATVGNTNAAGNGMSIIAASTLSSDYVLLCNRGTSTEAFRVRCDGEVYAPRVYTRGFSGGRDVYVDGAGLIGYNTSALKYKTNLRPFNILDNIDKIRACIFDSVNEDARDQIGVIADDFVDWLPEMVEYQDGEVETVSYGKLAAVAFRACQELKAENDALKARLDALESI